MNIASFELLWPYVAGALQALVSFRALAAIGLGAIVYWLVPHAHRPTALIPISIAIVLLGYQRPMMLVVAAAAICALIYLAVRRGAPRAWVVAGLVALYVALHGVFGLLTFTPWLDWSGLTPEYVLPTIGLTAAFTFLRLVHFSVDYGAGPWPGEATPRPPIPPHPLTYAAWCLFFPTFVHLPLIRYQDWSAQFMKLPGRLAVAHLRKGIWRIGQALFKGACLALVFTAFNPNAILLGPVGRPFLELFVAAIVSAIAYYIGFSAFMDLGIGAASLYGITLPENFAPALKMVRISRMRDFWRNWNITTTRWLNDYVYQPLGGHRRHPLRNVLLTMTACGLWHSVSVFGAAWGLGLGAILLAEHGWNRLRIRRGWSDAPPLLRSVLLLCAVAFVNLALTPYGYAAPSAKYLYPLYWLGLV